ncbi:glycosyltransferase family 25 protein [Burkholderia cenocepacia]|uniref:glycosyltransferase family 25 protein n=1 Tax=Burkholderia cenocepacia TaxID=95486 RepID=UPI0028770551|nr:glycosyltransferase family 25 protein [Burkholderia cenocepacia]MDS0851766.1 glycosyltransferase family 25 protein [Burkholderia cenocepacia]
MSTPVTDLRDATIAPVRACAVDVPSIDKTLRVISLQGERGRRDAFRANNPTLAFEFVDAIDGRALSDDDIARSGLFAPALPYTRGAIGIAMTTHRLWTDIAAGSELVTIVEDDAIFRPDFDETAMQFLAAHAGRYDFVAWGYNFDSILRGAIFNSRTPVTMRFDEAALAHAVDDFRNDRGPVLVMDLLEFYGICAYTISPAGARFLLDHCFPLRPETLFSHGLGRTLPNYGIDVAMNKFYGAMRSVAAFPPLAVTMNARETSTIQR